MKKKTLLAIILILSIIVTAFVLTSCKKDEETTPDIVYSFGNDMSLLNGTFTIKADKTFAINGEMLEGGDFSKYVVELSGELNGGENGNYSIKKVNSFNLSRVIFGETVAKDALTGIEEHLYDYVDFSSIIITEGYVVLPVIETVCVLIRDGYTPPAASEILYVSSGKILKGSDITNSRITVIFGNGEHKRYDIEEAVGLDTDKLGAQNVWAICEYGSFAITVTVYDEIVAEFDKSYPIGTTLADAIAEKTVRLQSEEDGDAVAITADMVQGWDSANAGTKTVTLSYKDTKETYSITFYNEESPAIDGMSCSLDTVVPKGIKLEDLGARFTAYDVLDNDTSFYLTDESTDISFTSYDINKVGAASFTVTYKGFTETFDVYVKDNNTVLPYYVFFENVADDELSLFLFTKEQAKLPQAYYFATLDGMKIYAGDFDLSTIDGLDVNDPILITEDYLEANYRKLIGGEKVTGIYTEKINFTVNGKEFYFIAHFAFADSVNRK